MLVTWPEALVLPGADAVPHDPATLGVVVNVTGSLKATPDPVVTVTVMADVLAPSSARLVGIGRDSDRRRRWREEPEGIDDDVHRNRTAVEQIGGHHRLSGARVKLWAIELAVKLASLAAGGRGRSVVG